uniref:C-type lectin domain-containing protein n=1 Tax=Erpetoichthys calabaricus TaxID=27687 RepID=A0A8C4RE56_ERPCA
MFKGSSHCDVISGLVDWKLFVLPVHGLQEFYYHYGNYQMTWANAQKYCRSNFTDLVTIASNEERKEILDMLAGINVSENEIWIGLKDIKMNSGTWSNGETFTYRNWNKGEPNNEKVACVVQLSLQNIVVSFRKCRKNIEVKQEIRQVIILEQCKI